MKKSLVSDTIEFYLRGDLKFKDALICLLGHIAENLENINRSINGEKSLGFPITDTDQYLDYEEPISQKEIDKILDDLHKKENK